MPPVPIIFQLRFMMVTILLVGIALACSPASSAAMLGRNGQCTRDEQCKEGDFCNTRTNSCVNCTTNQCSKWKRLPGSSSCPRSQDECGDCLPGYSIENEHCSPSGESPKMPSIGYTNDGRHGSGSSSSSSVYFEWSSLQIVVSVLVAAIFIGIVGGIVYWRCRRRQTTRIRDRDSQKYCSVSPPAYSPTAPTDDVSFEESASVPLVFQVTRPRRVENSLNRAVPFDPGYFANPHLNMDNPPYYSSMLSQAGHQHQVVPDQDAQEEHNAPVQPVQPGQNALAGFYGDQDGDEFQMDMIMDPVEIQVPAEEVEAPFPNFMDDTVLNLDVFAENVAPYIQNGPELDAELEFEPEAEDEPMDLPENVQDLAIPVQEIDEDVVADDAGAEAASGDDDEEQTDDAQEEQVVPLIPEEELVVPPCRTMERSSSLPAVLSNVRPPAELASAPSINTDSGYTSPSPSSSPHGQRLTLGVQLDFSISAYFRVTVQPRVASIYDTILDFGELTEPFEAPAPVNATAEVDDQVPQLALQDPEPEEMEIEE